MTAPAAARTPLQVDDSILGGFTRWLSSTRDLDFTDYQELRRWSATDLDGFWSAAQQYLAIPFRDPGETVLADDTMPGARWYPGVRTNYADSLLTTQDLDQPAVITFGEDGSTDVLTHREFRRQVASVAAALTDLGVGIGDRVAAFLPSIGQSAVAFFATASIGAFWASVGGDFAPDAAVARLGQLDPKVLIAADGYRYGGKPRDRRDAVNEIQAALQPEHTVIVPRLGLPVDASYLNWDDLTQQDLPLNPVAVDFDHPLWVLFTSGTTGVPKGIVHGHGGIQLEMHKMLQLHWDLRPGDRLLWATSPGWVMWNILISAPMAGATAVLYDGSPTFPDPAGIWRAVATHRINHFGTSPGFLALSERAGVEPGRQFDLSDLRHIISVGSPLPPQANAWSAQHVGDHVPVVSISGGTDVVGAFVGGAPTVPVCPGELSAGCLGVAVEAWDEHGKPVTEQVGELVVTRPMPSMPLRFWGDENGERYRDAYFSTYPGVWRHGDWITVTDRHSVIIHGRSDSTLNRNGIRMGSADIYRAVGTIPEVVESLVIGAELRDGGYWMPLFVALKDGTVLDDALRQRICDTIRHRASPRHVPDEILAVPAIPHTMTGKALEVPIKRILQGADPDTVITRSAVDKPELIDYYISLARTAVPTSGSTAGPTAGAASS